jgi:hypothetical protein
MGVDMKHARAVFAVLLLASSVVAEEKKDEKEPASATAVSDLYPNDMGPAEIDVSAYPKEIKQSYRTFAFKCAACHTIARPINSQFLELSQQEQAELKKSDPDLFKDPRLAHIEDKIWNRYVKRMMAKPGCPVKGEDGKKIWEFLVYDSKVRKTGANAVAWRKHRRELLHEFSEHYPDAYKKLFGAVPAPEED